jgi:hypothetical protein
MLSGKVFKDVLLTCPLIYLDTVWLWLALFIMDQASRTNDPGSQSYQKPNPLEKENFVENYNEQDETCKNTCYSCI